MLGSDAAPSNPPELLLSSSHSSLASSESVAELKLLPLINQPKVGPVRSGLVGKIILKSRLLSGVCQYVGRRTSTMIALPYRRRMCGRFQAY